MWSISDSLSAAKGVYFELAEPDIIYDIPGLKENGADIKLQFHTIDKNELNCVPYLGLRPRPSR